LENEIPNFDEHGNLPIGIHNSNMEDVIHRFGGSKSLVRSRLSKSLNEFYKFIRYYAIELYIAGSFTTSRLSPNDVDLLVILPADFFMNDPSVLWRYEQFQKNKHLYKLHIFGFRQGVDDVKIAGLLDWFRADRDGNPKGIIRLECK
jgi:hypothetical protein